MLESASFLAEELNDKDVWWGQTPSCWFSKNNLYYTTDIIRWAYKSDYINIE